MGILVAEPAGARAQRGLVTAWVASAGTSSLYVQSHLLPNPGAKAQCGRGADGSAPHLIPGLWCPVEREVRGCLVEEVQVGF